ncbi:MAG: hypothetical protein HYU59_05730 [Magnetospirillum gryphiswaldense]|nr:hypothetical protein [Magnetospirillum gryphiswaldense]
MPDFRRPYNLTEDPHFAQGINTLAKMFAPPSAQEVYAGAKAQETRQKVGMLADLYKLAKDPDFDQSRFDRVGAASGQWTPNQGYYAVDQHNATSRANNTADNARALEQTDREQFGQTERTLLGPVSAGATRFVPPSIAGMYGLPEQQVGVISASQGEKVVTPDGRTVMGAPKPLTKSEVEGRILAGLPDDIKRAVAIGGTPVESVVGPDNKPVIKFRADAVDMQPYDKPSGSPNTTNYRSPDGKTGTAVYDPILGWKDTQTGAALPQGAQTFDLKAQGTLAEVGLAPTTANNTSANNQAAEVTRMLNMLDTYEGLIDQNPGVVGLPGAIRGAAQNAVAAGTDFARAFGDKAPEVNETLMSIKTGLQGVAPEYFDQSIPEAQFLQGALAYGLARTENPSGEVSRQAFERAMERVQGGGMLANNQSTKAQIGAFRKVLQTQLQGIDVLRDPSKARTDVKPTAPGARERWERDPATGQLRKVQ